MNSLSTKKKIDRIFSSLGASCSIHDLDQIIKGEGFESAIENFKIKYPDIHFQITADEIQGLINLGILTSNYKLNNQYFPNLNALSRLLIATLWKNGQLNRIRHIAEGITDNTTNQSTDAFIFRQFGRSLADPQEPIVDKHVLRAFEIYNLKNPSAESIDKIRRKKSYNSDTSGLLAEYKKWFQSIIRVVPEEDLKAFKYKLDKILFLLGKEVKK